MVGISVNGRNKTKIAIIKPIDEPLSMWYGWCDGLMGAIGEMSKEFNVKVFGYSDVPAVIKRDGWEIQVTDNPSSLKYWLRSFNPKVIMGWGTAQHHWNEMNGFLGTKILLYAGGPPADTSRFDAVVVETPSDEQFFDNSYIAFGTNTDMFRPMPLNKLFPAVYPAAFALWKRHDLWAKAVPGGSLAVGHMQDHEPECFGVCIDEGHAVIGTVPQNIIPQLVNQAMGVVVTAEHMGGCQRLALEAMACNVPVLVTNDSKAAQIDGVWTCPPDVDNIRNAFLTMVTTFENETTDLREKYIVGKMDHIQYGRKLIEIIDEKTDIKGR